MLPLVKLSSRQCSRGISLKAYGSESWIKTFPLATGGGYGRPPRRGNVFEGEQLSAAPGPSRIPFWALRPRSIAPRSYPRGDQAHLTPAPTPCASFRLQNGVTWGCVGHTHLISFLHLADLFQRRRVIGGECFPARGLVPFVVDEHLPKRGSRHALGLHHNHRRTRQPFFFLSFFSKELFTHLQRERQGEKHGCQRATWIGCLLHAPDWGSSTQSRHLP